MKPAEGPNFLGGAITTLPVLERVCASLRDVPVFGLDSEVSRGGKGTTDLYKGQIEGVSVSYRLDDEIWSWYAPFLYYPNPLPMPTVMAALYDAALSDANKTVAVHEMFFDGRAMALNGYPLRGKLFCTRIAAWMLHNADRDNSLDACSKRELGFGKTSSFSQMEAGEDLFNRSNIVNYARRDADLHLRLYETYSKQIEEKGYASIWELEMGVLPDVMEMSLRGVPVDEAYLDELKKAYLRRLEELTEKIRVASNMPRLDPSSPQQVGKVLYENLGLVPPSWAKRGKSGAVTTEINVLVAMGGQHAILPLLVEHRHVSQYLENYVNLLMRAASDSVDGRVHPGFNQALQSGRMSIYKPALQTLPQVGEGIAIRKAIAAPKTRILIRSDYCVAPETKILKADLSWEEADRLKEGDELIGFDEDLSMRDTKFRSSVVTGVKRTVQPCFRIVTDRGAVTSSADHLWVARIRARRNGYPRRGLQPFRRWMKTKDLEVGDQICFSHAPWAYDHSREGGYMAGLLDGEGWCSGAASGLSQNTGPLLNEMLRILESKGIKCHQSKNGSGCVSLRPSGSLWNSCQMIGMFRPSRLIPKTRSLWEGRRTWGRFSSPAVILRIEDVGELETVALETSTKTFIAEGFLSHNSQIELRFAAFVSKDPAMTRAYAEEIDIHQQTADRVGITRHASKPINFGLIYRMSAKTLSEELKITDTQAQAYIDAWFSVYAMIPVWHQQECNRILTRGYSETIFGLKRYFPDVEKIKDDRSQRGRLNHIFRSGINHVIQGSAAQLCKIAIRNARAYRFGGKVEMVEKRATEAELRIIREFPAGVEEAFPILQIHDELIWEVPEERADDMAVWLRTIMETALYLPKIPIKADTKIVRSYGEDPVQKAA